MDQCVIVNNDLCLFYVPLLGLYCISAKCDNTIKDIYKYIYNIYYVDMFLWLDLCIIREKLHQFPVTTNIKNGFPEQFLCELCFFLDPKQTVAR